MENVRVQETLLLRIFKLELKNGSVETIYVGKCFLKMVSSANCPLYFIPLVSRLFST